MTTQLYPQIRTSTIRDKMAAFCEDRCIDIISSYFIPLSVPRHPFGRGNRLRGDVGISAKCKVKRSISQLLSSGRYPLPFPIFFLCGPNSYRHREVKLSERDSPGGGKKLGKDDLIFPIDFDERKVLEKNKFLRGKRKG